MNVNPFMFRAYDVRGKVGLDVTPEVFGLVGRAYGTLIKKKGGRAIALGRDNRVSSGPLKDAFGAGVLSTGLDVVDIGINHTPLLYFATAHWQLDGGATVTGSHNPVSDNGVKMVHAAAAPLTEEEIQGLLATIRAGSFERGAGTRTRRDPREDYFTAITERVTLARPLTVVVDAGNGIAGSFAPELLRRLGCRVVELYCESDGTFPNHLPDPEMEENMRDLIAKVIEVRADIGIAYDGDADRMGVVDERGCRHEADLILALLARDLLIRHPKARIVFDVKSSQALADDIRAHGGRPIMWKTGHSLLKQKMREDDILLGGEVSGHMFFGENWYGVDDGILASCKFLELCARSPLPVSSHFDTLPISTTRPS
jgi:phosphomannomutase